MISDFYWAYRTLQEERGIVKWQPLTKEKRAEVMMMHDAFTDFSHGMCLGVSQAKVALPMYNAAGMGVAMNVRDKTFPAIIFRTVDYPVTYADGSVYTDFELTESEMHCLEKSLEKTTDKNCYKPQNSTCMWYDTTDYLEPKRIYVYHVKLEVEEEDNAEALTAEKLNLLLGELRTDLIRVQEYIREKADERKSPVSFMTSADVFDEFWYEEQIFEWRDCIIHESSGADCGWIKVYEIDDGNHLISTSGMYGCNILLAVEDTDGMIRLYDAVECYKRSTGLYAVFDRPQKMFVKVLGTRNDAVVNYIVANVYGLGRYREMSDEEYMDIIERRLINIQLKRDRKMREWLYREIGCEIGWSAYDE